MSAVYKLTCSLDPLTVSMILTVRKLVSLVVSIVLFNNKFTVFHGCGTALVFTGAILFTLELSRAKQRQQQQQIAAARPPVDAAKRTKAE